MHFGEHLTVDGYMADKEKLNNKELVKRCLSELPKELNMNLLSQPEIYFAKGNDSKDPGGWSGFVVIEESHISIHTFPGRRFLSADVYTCKNGMDVDFIIDYFRKNFDIQDIEKNFIRRGTFYPDHNI